LPLATGFVVLGSDVPHHNDHQGRER